MGTPALHAAVSTQNAEAVKLLLVHGANVEALDSAGLSALCLACVYGSSEIVKLLLADNADLNPVSSGRGSALCAAACCGREGLVKLLFEKGARFREDDWANSGRWHTVVRVVPRDELDTVYELVKDQDPEEYIRILVEELSIYNVPRSKMIWELP